MTNYITETPIFGNKNIMLNEKNQENLNKDYQNIFLNSEKERSETVEKILKSAVNNKFQSPTTEELLVTAIGTLDLNNIRNQLILIELFNKNPILRQQFFGVTNTKDSNSDKRNSSQSLVIELNPFSQLNEISPILLQAFIGLEEYKIYESNKENWLQENKNKISSILTSINKEITNTIQQNIRENRDRLWDKIYHDADFACSFFTRWEISSVKSSPLPPTTLLVLALKNSGAALGILQNPIMRQQLTEILTIDDCLTLLENASNDTAPTHQHYLSAILVLLIKHISLKNLSTRSENTTPVCRNYIETMITRYASSTNNAERIALLTKIQLLFRQPGLIEALNLSINSLGILYRCTLEKIKIIEQNNKDMANYISKQGKVDDNIAATIANQPDLWKQIDPRYRYPWKTKFNTWFGWFKKDTTLAKQQLINKNAIFNKKFRNESIEPTQNIDIHHVIPCNSQIKKNTSKPKFIFPIEYVINFAQRMLSQEAISIFKKFIKPINNISSGKQSKTEEKTTLSSSNNKIDLSSNSIDYSQWQIIIHPGFASNVIKEPYKSESLITPPGSPSPEIPIIDDNIEPQSPGGNSTPVQKFENIGNITPEKTTTDPNLCSTPINNYNLESEEDFMKEKSEATTPINTFFFNSPEKETLSTPINSITPTTSPDITENKVPHNTDEHTNTSSSIRQKVNRKLWI